MNRNQLRDRMIDMGLNPPRVVVARNLAGTLSSFIGGPLVSLPWLLDLEILPMALLVISGAFFLRASFLFYKYADEIYEREYEILRRLWEDDNYG
jgi:hypothetical protein